MERVDDATAATFCSWSGGKDSALALHEAVAAGAEPGLLLTMMIENGERSRSHGLARPLLEVQATAMGLPIHFAATSWDRYTETIVAAIARHAVGQGMATGVFGDIDTAEHKAWVEAVCARAGASARLPLWQRSRASVMADVLAAGFEAVIVAGENGEFHTLVVDGPLFARRVEIALGERSLRDGVWFVDVAATAAAPPCACPLH